MFVLMLKYSFVFKVLMFLKTNVKQSDKRPSSDQKRIGTKY